MTSREIADWLLCFSLAAPTEQKARYDNLRKRLSVEDAIREMDQPVPSGRTATEGET